MAPWATLDERSLADGGLLKGDDSLRSITTSGRAPPDASGASTSFSSSCASSKPDAGPSLLRYLPSCDPASLQSIAEDAGLYSDRSGSDVEPDYVLTSSADTFDQ